MQLFNSPIYFLSPKPVMSTAAKPYAITEFSNLRLSSPIITNLTLQGEYTNTDGQKQYPKITLPKETTTLATTDSVQEMQNKRFDGTSTVVVKNTDPNTWTSISPDTTHEFIARVAGKLIAGTSTSIEYLDDGEWHEPMGNGEGITLADGETIQGITSSDSEFILWTSANKYYTSSDGRTWEAGTPVSPATSIAGMQYTNKALYLWGEGSTTYKLWRIDGNKWELQAESATAISGIAGDGDQGVLILNNSTSAIHTGKNEPVTFPEGGWKTGADSKPFWIGDRFILQLQLSSDASKLAYYTYTTDDGFKAIYYNTQSGTLPTMICAGNHCILGVQSNALKYSMDSGESWRTLPYTLPSTPLALYTNNRFDIIARTSTDEPEKFYVYRSNVCGKISIKFDEMADFFASSGGGDTNTKYIIQLMRYIAYKFKDAGLYLDDVFDYVDPDDELDARIADTSQGHGAGGLS